MGLIIWTLSCLGLVLAGGGGYATYSQANVGYSAGAQGVCSVGTPQSCDFNPLLLVGSQRGYPGIRARLNQRAFQYASPMIADVLNQEIKKARIPPITQCVPMVNGCIQIYNLYVSRYRCPQRVVLYPAPPNRLVLQVQNVDIGVTGNLGGQIVVLLPIQLTGIVQLNIQQVTITVSLSIERGPTGPYIAVQTCDVQIGYADAYIENGGLIGDIVNSQFRSQISGMVKQMIPKQVCGQIPTLVNEKLNGKLSSLPQTIALKDMLSLFSGALSGPSPQYCASQCGSVPAGTPAAPPVLVAPIAPPVQVSGGAAPVAPQIPTDAYAPGKAAARGVVRSYNTRQTAVPSGLVPFAPKRLRTYRAVGYVSGTQHKVMYVPVSRAKRQVTHQRIVAAGTRIQRHSSGGGGFGAVGGGGGFGPAPGAGLVPRYPPPPPVVSNLPPPNDPPPNQCSKCPSAAGQEDPASFLRQLTQYLDMNKLNDIYLSVQLLNTYATLNDFTVDLTGEFSPFGQGGTPFGPFPTTFPAAYDTHMAEFIVSDYTVNSLFYWLHKKQFLSFRIGPETPKIGELLRTTCSDDEDELEPSDIELEEEELRRRRKKALSAAKTLRVRRAAGVAALTGRGKRQDAQGLADLGICFGDILPAVREKYPNQKIAVVIRTVRAPSIILSQAQGGSATLDLIANADIYIDGTNAQVGSITISATVVLVVQVYGSRITGSAQIAQLHLSDQTGSLGLPQDALDNLGNLGKELLTKVANDALAKGINVNMASGGLAGLPINIINPSIRIIEHGLYIATDVTISPSLLGITGTC